MRHAIPIEPDAETARAWLEEELSKPEYTVRPAGWFQRLQDWIFDLIDRIFSTLGGGGNLSSPGAIAIFLLVLAVVGVLLYLFLGPLRRSRSVKKSAAVFEDDEREASEIREAAVSAADRGDWTMAVIERFRSLVRSVEERNLVLVVPGMTAQEFTAAVGERLEGHATALHQCAELFDAVRYGHRTADRAAYEFMVRTDDAVAKTRPKARA